MPGTGSSGHGASAICASAAGGETRFPCASFGGEQPPSVSWRSLFPSPFPYQSFWAPSKPGPGPSLLGSLRCALLSEPWPISGHVSLAAEINGSFLDQ